MPFNVAKVNLRTYLENAIWGNEGGLSSGNVVAYYFSVWKLVGHVYCPDTCAGAEVKNTTTGFFEHRVCDRGKIKLVVEKQEELLVLKIVAIELLFIYWYAILVLSEGTSPKLAQSY